MNINICRANTENSIEISALTNELGYAVNEIHTKDWLNYLLNSENHCVFVALNSSKVVCGWVVIEKRISLESGFKAEITGLVVGEKYRRFGIAKKLISSAIKWARDLNLPKVVVRSNVQREESHIFYKKIGFDFTKSSHSYEINI